MRPSCALFYVHCTDQLLKLSAYYMVKLIIRVVMLFYYQRWPLRVLPILKLSVLLFIALNFKAIARTVYYQIKMLALRVFKFQDEKQQHMQHMQHQQQHMQHMQHQQQDMQHLFTRRQHLQQQHTQHLHTHHQQLHSNSNTQHLHTQHQQLQQQQPAASTYTASATIQQQKHAASTVHTSVWCFYKETPFPHITITLYCKVYSTVYCWGQYRKKIKNVL